MRRALVVGNAKMNLSRSELGRLLEGLKQDLALNPPACEVAYCPPFPMLPDAQGILSSSPISLGAQNMAARPSGAWTGEVSGSMLLECGCRWVILGHSERRAHFGETDETVRAKVGLALELGLVPIVCVGETEAERKAGATEVVLSRQTAGSLGGLALGDAGQLVVAYEPVWAIGTGQTATPEQAQEAHRHLRGELGQVLGAPYAAGVRILYGGSVKPDNAAALLGQPDIDGALVGGASLQLSSFLGIVGGAPPTKQD